jgi:hypothetical protein
MLEGALSPFIGNPIPFIPFPLIRARGGISKRGFVPLEHPTIRRETNLRSET